MVVKKRIKNEHKYYDIFVMLNLINRWKLSNNELRVMAAIYNFFYYYKSNNPSLSFADIKNLVFTKKNRDLILKSLGIKYAVFMNIKSKLIKQGLLTEDKGVNPTYYVDIVNTDKFTIKYETQ